MAASLVASVADAAVTTSAFSMAKDILREAADAAVDAAEAAIAAAEAESDSGSEYEAAGGGEPFTEDRY